MPLRRARKVPETEPNHGESRVEITGNYLGLCVQSADFIVETAEQPFAVPEASAYFID